MYVILRCERCRCTITSNNAEYYVLFMLIDGILIAYIIVQLLEFTGNEECYIPRFPLDFHFNYNFLFSQLHNVCVKWRDATYAIINDCQQNVVVHRFRIPLFSISSSLPFSSCNFYFCSAGKRKAENQILIFHLTHILGINLAFITNDIICWLPLSFSHSCRHNRNKCQYMKIIRCIWAYTHQSTRWAAK